MAYPLQTRYRTHRTPMWPLALGLGVVAALVTFTATAAVKTPPGVVAVADFNPDRYLGHWYEVARIDHIFEKGLVRTSATYSRNPDGTVKVYNRGYDPLRERWRDATGRAEPIDGLTRGAFKVSFFGPFWSGYHVVALDSDYRWSMVIGSKLDYLWILSRTPTLPPGVRERLLEQARALGVDVDRILWVPQGDSDAPAPASASAS